MKVIVFHTHEVFLLCIAETAIFEVSTKIADCSIKYTHFDLNLINVGEF